MQQMCGKYTLMVDKMSGEMRVALDLCGINPENKGFDISPDTHAPVLLVEENRVTISSMKWGFSRDGEKLTINARSESVTERAMFRSLTDRGRCALPAMGYYEWRDSDHQKYLICSRTNAPIYLAGLYRTEENGERRFVVLTRDALGEHAKIHSRMPVVIESRLEARQWIWGLLSLNELISSNTVDLKVCAVGPEQLSMDFEAYSE